MWFSLVRFFVAGIGLELGSQAVRESLRELKDGHAPAAAAPAKPADVRAAHGKIVVSAPPDTTFWALVRACWSAWRGVCAARWAAVRRQQELDAELEALKRKAGKS